MEVAFCKSCGAAFDPEESPDGYCVLCDPEEARQLMRNLQDLDAE